jgi:signal transduction histidine kinase/ActR/RegA family two-component response regulator
MKLRTQISLFLFLFGLLPLFAALIINIPLIFDRIESLYHKAHLQNLRAGFGDLDQHIARRHEMARLLAKFPEPGVLLDAGNAQTAEGLLDARSGYIAWINQVLVDQLDIVRIVFLDGAGEVRFWLDRNNATRLLEPGAGSVGQLNRAFVQAGLKLQPGGVLTGPIVFDHETVDVDPNKFMQLGLISPFIPRPGTGEEDTGSSAGGVIVYMDVGGLAGAYRGVYWAHADGRYLGSEKDGTAATTAFEDFPGLQELFGKGELDLWDYQGQRVLWVPMFATELSGPLWAGRSVDASPIDKLRRAIEIRVATIVVGLLLVVYIVARFIALRTERFGNELTDGISRVMEHDEAVQFSWARPEELRVLGNNLTRLAVTHTEHSTALREYAHELEESNRYKSEFLANVSHELRTPLNSILLLSKMLAESSGAHPGEQEKQARVIHAAGADLKSLIDNILDLSRIEARQMTLLAEPVKLRELLDSVIDLLRPQYVDKGLSLELVIEPGAPESVISDSDKLRQILVNFLSNAVKFTRQGGVSIRLQSCPPETAPEHVVCISVEDTGIGIPPGKQEVIFEAFKQADGSTSRRFGGTGLGLTISRELAHLVGGEITIESEPGRGSVFTLLLPEVAPQQHPDGDGDRPTAREPREDIQESIIPEADYAGRRVLLVDDDMRNLLAMTPLLERWNLSVMAAGDGDEALETLRSDGDFDLILMDIMMPELDGYEVTRLIRSTPAFAHIPVIALTARAGYEDRRASLEAGANECLVKPVDPGELKAMLDDFFTTAPGTVVP